MDRKALARRYAERRRGDALEKRRAMMEAWAQWCEPRDGDNVVVFQIGRLDRLRSGPRNLLPARRAN